MSHAGALILAAALVTGCATTMTDVERIAKSYDEDVYALWTNVQGVTLLTTNCPILTESGEINHLPRWADQFDPADNTKFRGFLQPACVNVAGTRDPQDTKFWTFELHRITQLTMHFGIPVSPRFKSDDTMTIGVVGPRDACERVRVVMDRKPQGVAGDDSMHMTKGPCEGPRYFRRPGVSSD
jgi:hypothetical protein